VNSFHGSDGTVLVVGDCSAGVDGTGGAGVTSAFAEISVLVVLVDFFSPEVDEQDQKRQPQRMERTKSFRESTIHED
jgi:hypothetical protein